MLGDRSEMSPLPPCQHFKKTAATTITPACTPSSQHPLSAARCLSISPSKISHLPCLPSMAQDKRVRRQQLISTQSELRPHMLMLRVTCTAPPYPPTSTPPANRDVACIPAAASSISPRTIDGAAIPGSAGCWWYPHAQGLGQGVPNLLPCSPPRAPPWPVVALGVGVALAADAFQKHPPSPSQPFLASLELGFPGRA